MSPTSVTKIKNIDHLGIVAGLIDEIGIVEIINSKLGIDPRETISAGNLVKFQRIFWSGNDKLCKLRIYKEVMCNYNLNLS